MEERRKTAHLLRTKLKECQDWAGRRTACDAKYGEAHAYCQSLWRSEISCMSGLLCPRETRKALECYRDNGNDISKCLDLSEKMQTCLDSALDRMAKGSSSFDQGAEQRCGKFADQLEQCLEQNNGDESHCEPEKQTMDSCMSEFLCPDATKAFKLCLARHKGDRSKCNEQDQQLSSCILDKQLAQFQALGIPVELHEESFEQDISSSS
ncbi:hypothetical protein QOT17_021828 [Balamuthia mandrillaris]